MVFPPILCCQADFEMNLGWKIRITGKEIHCSEKRKDFLFCSDVDKYKYSPGDHKIAATLRSPGHFLLLPFVKMAVFTNDFPLVKVREGLPEGKGLFSKIDIPCYRSNFLCNYWGEIIGRSFKYVKDEGLRYG